MSTEKCTVEDSKHVRPCKWLAESVEGRGTYGRERGVRIFDYSSNGVPTRTFFGIKSGTYPKGIAIDFCPFCGTKINAPFTDEPEAATQAPSAAKKEGQP